MLSLSWKWNMKTTWQIMSIQKKTLWIIWRRFHVAVLPNKKKNQEVKSSQPKERMTMDKDWWPVTVLIPEEGLTSVITISSSNTQSRQSMAPKWQKMLCCSPEKWGRFPGKECASARFFGYLFWSGQRLKALLFFWMVPGRVELWLCVLTPWNVWWKRKFRSCCQHCARVFPAVVANDYYRHVCTKTPCSVSDFYDLKMVVTHFEMALFECWSGSNLSGLRVICGSGFEGFETIHYWFITVYSSTRCGLKEHQVCTATNFVTLSLPFLTEQTKYIL